MIRLYKTVTNNDWLQRSIHRFLMKEYHTGNLKDADCVVRRKCHSVCPVTGMTRGLSGYRARRRVADSRGPLLVAGLSLNK
jgi:hypothetical protein